MDILSENLLAWQNFTDGPLQAIPIRNTSVSLSIQRLDCIQSWASGNKYFKLKYSISDALEHGTKSIVSKGGPNSNHLEALAASCAQFELTCICIIRSHQDDVDNPTIVRLRNCGAQLHFLTPNEYQSFDQKAAEEMYPGSLFIPEGGSHANGFKGAKEIYSTLDTDGLTHLIIAGGTMTTAAGIVSAADSKVNIIIVPAWKGCSNEYFQKIFSQFNISSPCNWELWPGYHFGGFAKYSQELANFMFSFTSETSIPLDPVYTGKMMYAIYDKLNEGYFAPNDKIICIHTGGLQGIAGFNHRDPEVWNDYYKLAVSR